MNIIAGPQFPAPAHREIAPEIEAGRPTSKNAEQKTNFILASERWAGAASTKSRQRRLFAQSSVTFQARRNLDPPLRR